MVYYGTKRRVFISYSQRDRNEVGDFINRWAFQEQLFTPYSLGVFNDTQLINSTNPQYVMSQIRQKFLQDSTVTIVLMGTCTHSRRYVDWEVKASLQQGQSLPNGLLAICLPSLGDNAHLPNRIYDNWSKDGSGYVQFISTPSSAQQFGDWIETAFNARTSKAHLIKNSQEMMKYNAKCRVHNVTH